MKTQSGLHRVLFYVAAVIASLAVPVVVFGQGCALCVTQAAQGGNHFIQALRSGILVLVFPPMAICVAIIYVSWRKRNHFREQ